MTLAFQCGIWDLDSFDPPKTIMDRWENWFRRRPQGQYHLSQLLSSIGASLLAAQGVETTHDHFLWWDKEPESEETVEESWNAVKHLFPVAKPAEAEEKNNGGHGNTSQQSGTGDVTVSSWGQYGNPEQQGSIRID